MLQGSYFTAVDLSEIASGLDEEERQQMSENENGIESWVKVHFPFEIPQTREIWSTLFISIHKNREDYKKFLQQPSGNMDDTGFFSVQVISKALALWNLELIPLNSTDTTAIEIRQNPTKAQAYIFNMESHWYCIRRFTCDPTQRPPSNETYAFFNLDSLLSRPDFMSNSFLTEYLKQMQNEGYSIFIVSGEFPESAAEPLRYEPNTTLIDLAQSESKASVSEQDEDVQRAIQLSLADYSDKYDRFQLPAEKNIPSSSETLTSTDRSSDLDAALKLSLDCFGGKGQELSGTTPSETLTPIQLRDKRLAYFSAMSSNEKWSDYSLIESITL